MSCWFNMYLVRAYNVLGTGISKQSIYYNKKSLQKVKIQNLWQWMIGEIKCDKPTVEYYLTLKIIKFWWYNMNEYWNIMLIT
jgi:hypothetical protein